MNIVPFVSRVTARRMSAAAAVRSGAAWALLALLATGAAAQTAPSGGVAVEIGAWYHGQSDQAASPLRYTGSGVAVGVGWHRSRAESRLAIAASFGMGGLSSGLTRDGLPSEDVWLGGIDARYLRRVGTLADGRVTLLVGGDLRARASFRVHEYVVHEFMEARDESFADLLAPLSLAGGWEWDADVVRVGQRLSIPVVGVAVRTPYGGLKYTPRVQLVGPTGLTGFGQELFVETGVSRLLDVRASWSLEVLHHDDPRRLDVATHRFAVRVYLHGAGER